MVFLWPGLLFLLILVPLLAVFYLMLMRRRRKAQARFAASALFMNAAGGQAGFRRHLPPIFFLSGLTILIVALARPQTVVSLPRVEGTVILAFDVSGSMAASDLKPTRMDAAKAAAVDFVNRQSVTVQIGVVAFSDSGFAVQAPSHDREAILAAINRLTPQRGTSVGHGIQGALNALDILKNGPPNPEEYSNRTPVPTPSPTPVPPGVYTNAVIVLLSDGENNESPDPLSIAKLAADRGVRIDTVGIGSAAGTTVHVNGYNIHTQLDEATLQQIAQISGGTYYNAQSAEDLVKIYDNLNTQWIVRPQKTEVTSLLGGASILILLMGGAFSLGWFTRLP